MGSAVSVTSSLGDISSEAIEDFCNEITGQDYTDVFVKHSVDGKVLEKYVGNVDTLLEFLNDIGMTDLDHQQMLYDAMMQMVCSHKAVIMENNIYYCENCHVKMTTMLAALNGHAECISHTLDKTGDLMVRNVDGTTALHLAASGGHVECLDILLTYDRRMDEEKPLINCRDRDGWTPVMIAAASNSIPCLASLINGGARLDIINCDGRTALHLAAVSGKSESVKTLLQHSSSTSDAVALQDAEGMTSLMLAAAGGHLACVQHLLHAGSNVEVANDEGATAVMLSSLNGHETCISCLLEHGADITTTNIDDTTCLMLAASGGHFHCVRLLLEKGADVKAQNNEGATAIMFASENGHVKCEEILSNV